MFAVQEIPPPLLFVNNTSKPGRKKQAMSDPNGGFGGVVVGKTEPTKPDTNKPEEPVSPKPNQNLTSSLRASLTLIENENSIPSPLLEADPNSVDLFLERINNHMVEGKILTDEDLKLGIDLYRAQALRFEQEQQTKKPRAKAGTKPTIKEVLDLEL
jgi:hypothetical protein